MAVVVTGFDTQFKTVTVANNDVAINAEIATQDTENWIVVSLTLSGANMVILFTRTIVSS